VTEIRARNALRLATIQRWALRGGLFLLPLAYSWDTYDRWVLPKLLLGRALVIVLLGLLVARAIVDGRLILKRTPLDLPIAAFVASAALSTAVASNANVAIFGIYSRYDGLLTLITYAALFWLALQTLKDPQDGAALLRTMQASAYVVAAVAIAQSVVQSMQPDVWLKFTDVLQGNLVRASGTLGQWNVLGGFLAMTWPLALWELARARSAPGRLLALNSVVVIALALVMTFSRSSWMGAIVGIAVLVVGSRAWRDRRVLAAGGAAVVGACVLSIALATGGGSQFESAVVARAGSVLHPDQWETRPLYWRDSLKLIASRPTLGYGPDNFGLVFPRFNAVFYHEPVDKAHAETLQILATQGLVGLGAYAWIIAAFVLTFWRGRHLAASYAIFGGWLAYELSLQVNFTALGSALPFWIFAAAAMHSWGAVRTSSPIELGPRRLTTLRVGIGALAVLALIAVALPYLADVSLLEAVEADQAGRYEAARAIAGQAHSLGPRESVYAVEVANIAFEREDWATARTYYGRAAGLGTYNPLVYRNLAFADRHLGLLSEGRAAALAAYELNRYDPVNQAVLAQFGGPGA
jgi:O-antigen ligase